MDVPLNYLNIYTTPRQAEQINIIISNYINTKECTITDATACIGGNSLLFLRDFKHVNIVEKDFNVYKILIKNLNSFNNKNTYNCSYNIIKFTLKQDVIFIDPPWGGTCYKNKKKIKLYIDDINIIDIINDLYHFAEIVCLKIPSNFDLSCLSTYFWYNKIYNITKNKKCIYKLLIFYK
jgi:predicted RNA methylase